jgi:hypothetical protein
MTLAATDVFAAQSGQDIASRVTTRSPFLGSLAILMVLLVVWTILQGAQDTPVNYLCAGLILAAALLPAFVWASHPRRYGLPIFPLHAFTFVWAYGMPVLDNHPLVSQYTSAERLGASVVLAAYLVLGTVVWMRVWRRPHRMPARAWVLRSGEKDNLFFGFLLIGLAYEVLARGAWLNWLGNALPVLRAVLASAFFVSVLALSYRLGRGEWPIILRIAFVGLLIAHMLATSTSLLLVYAIVTLAAAVFGFTLGRGRVPWIWLGVALLAFSFLHLGKEQVRRSHWVQGYSWVVRPENYLDLYVEWFEAGVRRLSYTKDQEQLLQSSRSMVERASLLQMMLRTYGDTPERIPYLYGKTYSVVPLILVPRMFMPNKPASHEGTYLLNIHYGLQDREGAYNTTIGWGLPSEAYANFGVPGVLGLALVLGWFFARVERYARGMPVHSFRVLFAFLVVAMAINNEATMGVFASVLLQGTVGLGALLAFMHARPIATGARDGPLGGRAPE